MDHQDEYNSTSASKSDGASPPGGKRERIAEWLRLRIRTINDFVEAINAFERKFEAWSPTIIGGFLMLLSVAALQLGWIGQLSDIFSLDSARDSLKDVPWIATLKWTMIILVSVLCWGLPFLLVIQANYAQAHGNRRPDPASEHRKRLLKFFAGKGIIQVRFLRIVFWSIAIGLIPLLFCWGWHSYYQGTNKDIDPYNLALVGACWLPGMLILGIVLWRLGVSAQVGWASSLLPLMPAILVAHFLFAFDPRFEKGENPLNALTVSESQFAENQQPSYRFAPPEVVDPPASPTQLLYCRKPNHGQGPFVFICASGGGSRAALFTAGILSRMWWQQESLSPARRKTFTNLPEHTELQDKQPDSQGNKAIYPGRLFLLRADALSSVSGGSLAMCYLANSLYDSIKQSTSDPAMARAQALKQFFDPVVYRSSFHSPHEIMWYGEKSEPTNLKEFFPEDPAQFDPKEVYQKRFEHFECNPFINAMRQNHQAAAIAGFFTWDSGRGPGIENFWESRFDWYQDAGRKHSRLLSDFCEEEMTGALPSLILNATLTCTGTRLAITNLAPSEFKADSKFGPSRDQSNLGESVRLTSEVSKAQQYKREDNTQSRYDPLPGQINTLNELDPTWHIPLKTAMRASSNVPYCFPLIRFLRHGWYDAATQRVALWQNQVRQPEDFLEIADGGVIDNSGVDTVMALLRAHPKMVQDRGVLIIQINSDLLESDQPVSKSGGFNFHYYVENNNALWRAKFNTETTAHMSYRDQLELLAGERMGEDTVEIDGQKMHNSMKKNRYTLGFKSSHCAYYQIRAGELANEDVMTAWHLDRKSRAVLYNEIFAPYQKETILRAAEWLAEHEKKRSLKSAASPASKTDSTVGGSSIH